MELQSFDLLWLPEPIDVCVHDEEPLQLHDAEFDLHVGPHRFTYIVRLGRCPACGQWYGLLPVLEDLHHEAGVQMQDIGGFSIEGEQVTTGVAIEQPPLPWSTFAEQMDAMQAAQDQPTPTVEEVQALDQSSVTWELGQASTAWVGEDDKEAELAYVALVHDPNLIRSIDLEVGAPLDAEDLAALVRRAAGTPQPPGEPGRPRAVRVADEEMADALSTYLDPLAIAVEVADTPLASEALNDLAVSIGGTAGPPVFQDVPEDRLRAFLDTAERFYEAEPWTRTEGDRFLGVQIDDAPWFFVNVMGQMGDTPGLTLFDDWPTVCRFIHNDRASPYLDEIASPLFDAGRPDAPDPFEAAGAMEGITLHERDLLHPADADHLNRLSIGPPVNGQYPAPQRFEFEAGAVAPRASLDTYRRVMEAILIALARRHATPVTSIKTTLDIDGKSVSLRYPSEGTERPYDGLPGYRLVLQGHDHDGMVPDSRLPAGTKLVIEAPATALFKDIAKAAKKSQDSFYEFSLYDWNVCLWNDTESRRNPSPRVADLTALDEMDVELGSASFQLHVDRPLDTAPDDIRIQRQS